MNPLVQSGLLSSLADSSLHRPLEYMVSPLSPRPWAARQLPRGKHKLPAQLLCRLGILPFQCIRQIDARHPTRQVPLMQQPSVLQLPLQISPRRLRQHHHAILGAFSLTDHDLAAQ